MSMLANVTKGKIVRPALILIYGPGGIGKSTFGANSPSPIFMGAEEGTDHLDVSRFPTPKNLEDVTKCLEELVKSPHAFKTLVVDSLDWIEPLVFEFICRKFSAKSIELACGGYGKGYIEAANEWAKLRLLFTALRDKRKMNVILLAHPEVVSTTNPQTQTTYQRYEMKLHKRSKQHFMEYVDAMFFASYSMYIHKDGDTVKAVSTEQRVLHPNWKDGFDAKNRYGLTEPVDLSTPWDAFMDMCQIGTKAAAITINKEEVRHIINVLMGKIQDAEIIEKAKEYLKTAGEDAQSLMSLKTRLEEITTTPAPTQEESELV